MATSSEQMAQFAAGGQIFRGGNLRKRHCPDVLRLAGFSDIVGNEFLQLRTPLPEGSGPKHGKTAVNRAERHPEGASFFLPHFPEFRQFPGKDLHQRSVIPAAAERTDKFHAERFLSARVDVADELLFCFPPEPHEESCGDAAGERELFSGSKCIGLFQNPEQVKFRTGGRSAEIGKFQSPLEIPFLPRRQRRPPR